MKGFAFSFKGKNYFVETARTNKTRRLAEEILPLIGCSVTEYNIKSLLLKFKRANCEIRTATTTNRKEKRYYAISGDGFGGIGGWVDGDETVILKID